jgi:hypothetical protein
VKRTKIHIHGKAYYSIRDSRGRFKNIENIGRAISQDAARQAKTKAKPGYGFQGDIERQ